MNQEQRESLWGPEPQYSEHKRDEVITFNDNGTVKTGRIQHVMAPATIDGIAHGVRYVVAVKERGFPSIIAPGDVII